MEKQQPPSYGSLWTNERKKRRKKKQVLKRQEQQKASVHCSLKLKMNVQSKDKTGF